jgi:tetratricopeptide (TPR) repeat protein
MIYTFYSYKGGAGRSMALANVAEWLYRQGLRVVMVDWDLEAPGLEAFFYQDQSRLETLRSQLGVIDALVAYRNQFPQLPLSRGEPSTSDAVSVLDEFLFPISTMLHQIEPEEHLSDGSQPGLWLLTAGWRAGDRFREYARAVQEFSWGEFYARFQGEAYFEWLRSQLEKVADVVLLDSRTGVTEMGGVCTRQLADVVVSFCVPNLQNLAGTVSTAQSFTRDDVSKARGKPVRVIVVPARIENSEITARNEFELRFKEELKPFLPAEFSGRTFWDLRVPYVPKYAYVEHLALAGPDSAEELAAAYKGLAAHLTLLAPIESPLRRVWDEYSLTTGPSAVDVVRARRNYDTELVRAKKEYGPDDLQTARAHAGLGLALLTQNDVEEGIKHVEEAQEILSRNVQSPAQLTEPIKVILEEAVAVLADLANFHHLDEEYETAVRYLTVALKLSPGNPDLLLQRGTSHWYDGSLQDAIDDFAEALGHKSDWPEALHNRGQALAEAGRYEDAIKDLQRAIELTKDADMAYAHNGLGLAYGGLGIYERAMKEFSISLDQAPGNAWVHLNRGLTLEKMGESEPAKKEFAVALKLTNPSLTRTKREMATARLTTT